MTSAGALRVVLFSVRETAMLIGYAHASTIDLNLDL